MNLNTHFLIDIELANRYMKRCSTSLLIRESPIKITRTYHLIPVRIAIIKKKDTFWWGCGGKKKNSRALWKSILWESIFCGKVYWYICYGRYYGVFSKNLKKENTLQSSNFTIRYYPKQMTAFSQRDICIPTIIVHTHTHTHTHTQILFASCEHRMNLLDIMLSEKWYRKTNITWSHLHMELMA